MPTYRYPPGPKPGPIFGNAMQLRKGPLDYVTQLQRTYGDAATIYLGKRPAVLFARPEAIRYVLIENARNFTNREATENLRLLLGDGLLTSDGDFHRQQRRLVQPAFHRKRVESYAGVMVSLTEEMLATWQPESQINIAEAMQRLTLRIITKTLFNVDSQETTEQLGRAFNTVIENSPRFGRPPARSRWNRQAQRRLTGKRTLDTFVYDLIAERRAQGEDVG